MSRIPESRAQLLEDRDEALTDEGARAAFLSYRLNVPTQDDAVSLLTVEDWQANLGAAGRRQRRRPDGRG